MAGLRGFRAILRAPSRLVLVAPLLALFLSVLMDRGSDGEGRLSRFPLALLAVDPLVPTCARNSIVFAVALSLSSLGLGIALGWVLGRRAFWGRPLWRVAVVGLLAASPAILALGIVGMLGPPRLWPWPFSSAGVINSGVSLESSRGLGLWLVWLWSSLPAATALVTVATTSAVERLEPSWEDAARLAGAGRFRSWSTLSWPLIRPPAARAAALVFALGLAEPGAPLILGLRRTLAFQIVDAASRPAPFPGISAWCVLTFLIAFVGVMGLRRLGGTPILTKSVAGDFPPRTRPLPRPASLPHAVGSIAILTAWCFTAWLPLLGLIRLAVGRGDPQSVTDSGRVGALGVLSRRMSEPIVRRLATNSAVVGLEVAGAVVLLFWLIGSRRRGRGQTPSTDRDRAFSPIVFAPPLIVGVGVLAIPWVVEATLGWLPASGPGSGLAHALASSAGWLTLSENPSLFLKVSVAWVLGPMLFFCWRPGQGSSYRRSPAIDAARLAGASRLGALWLGAPGLVVIWLGRFALAWSLAAANLTPALLASPGTDGPTVAPGLLILAAGNPHARSVAASLALLILALYVAALTVARASGALPRSGDCEQP
jgi:ABC-type Fe3+ transport system permease subunit